MKLFRDTNMDALCALALALLVALTPALAKKTSLSIPSIRCEEVNTLLSGSGHPRDTPWCVLFRQGEQVTDFEALVSRAWTSFSWPLAACNLTVSSRMSLSALPHHEPALRCWMDTRHFVDLLDAPHVSVVRRWLRVAERSFRFQPAGCSHKQMLSCVSHSRLCLLALSSPTTHGPLASVLMEVGGRSPSWVSSLICHPDDAEWRTLRTLFAITTTPSIAVLEDDSGKPVLRLLLPASQSASLPARVHRILMAGTLIHSQTQLLAAMEDCSSSVLLVALFSSAATESEPFLQRVDRLHRLLQLRVAAIDISQQPLLLHGFPPCVLAPLPLALVLVRGVQSACSCQLCPPGHALLSLSSLERDSLDAFLQRDAPDQSWTRALRQHEWMHTGMCSLSEGPTGSACRSRWHNLTDEAPSRLQSAPPPRRCPPRDVFSAATSLRVFVQAECDACVRSLPQLQQTVAALQLQCFEAVVHNCSEAASPCAEAGVTGFPTVLAVRRWDAVPGCGPGGHSTDIYHGLMEKHSLLRWFQSASQTALHVSTHTPIYDDMTSAASLVIHVVSSVPAPSGRPGYPVRCMHLVCEQLRGVCPCVVLGTLHPSAVVDKVSLVRGDGFEATLFRRLEPLPATLDWRGAFHSGFRCEEDTATCSALLLDWTRRHFRMPLTPVGVDMFHSLSRWFEEGWISLPVLVVLAHADNVSVHAKFRKTMLSVAEELYSRVIVLLVDVDEYSAWAGSFRPRDEQAFVVEYPRLCLVLWQDHSRAAFHPPALVRPSSWRFGKDAIVSFVWSALSSPSQHLVSTFPF